MAKNLLQRISSSTRGIMGAAALSLALTFPSYAETQPIDLGRGNSLDKTYKVEMTRPSAAPLLKQYTEQRPVYLLGELDKQNQTITLIYSTVDRGQTANRETPEINTSDTKLYILAPEGAEFEILDQKAVVTDGEYQETVQLKPLEKTKFAKRVKNFGDNILTRARAYDPIEAVAEGIDTWFGSEADAPLKDKMSIYGLIHFLTKDKPENQLRRENQGMQLYEIQPWARDSFVLPREIGRITKLRIDLSNCPETMVPIGAYQKVGIKSQEQQGKLEAMIRFEMENENPEKAESKTFFCDFGGDGVIFIVDQNKNVRMMFMDDGIKKAKYIQKSKEELAVIGEDNQEQATMFIGNNPFIILDGRKRELMPIDSLEDLAKKLGKKSENYNQEKKVETNPEYYKNYSK